MTNSEKPKRRQRYKGTHPKRFEEKYKELHPDKYVQDLTKIKSRGATPAGTHRSIMVNEVLEHLHLKNGDQVLDATLGYGGHAQEILKKILPTGQLIALDQDPIEREKTEHRLREKGFSDLQLIVGGCNFSDSELFLRNLSIPRVNAVFADLGLSSMQIDDPSRGFTTKIDVDLDLRMNPHQGLPAHDFIQNADLEKLESILREHSDEPRARMIAKALFSKKPKTTFEFVSCIRECMKSFSKRVQQEEGDVPIRRALQAIRIEINDEFGALDRFLESLPRILKPNGRVVILSFHSGEDRRVKKAFQQHFRAGLFREISDEFIRPSFEEQNQNSRSKPTKLRWAIRK